MERSSTTTGIAAPLLRPWSLLSGWIGHARQALANPGTGSDKSPSERRRERRRPTEGAIEFAYVDQDERVLQGSGSLVDRSESGVRFVTRARLRKGAEFLIWDPRRVEYAATVVWTKRRADGYLVGAQTTRVGRPA